MTIAVPENFPSNFILVCEIVCQSVSATNLAFCCSKCHTRYSQFGNHSVNFNNVSLALVLNLSNFNCFVLHWILGAKRTRKGSQR